MGPTLARVALRGPDVNELHWMRLNGSEATARSTELLQQTIEEIRAIVRGLPE